ncbi:hypothetical protein BBJ28_00000526 [Nothophytophthora sp. Chile5]|nr:hypothetical protein BBJ28_00000526 [Nothophytophthora sp. Chile5]
MRFVNGCVLAAAVVVAVTLDGHDVAAEAQADDEDETSCWEIEASMSPMAVLATYTGSACAVDVTFPLVASSYAPNESVALLWGVELNADSSNDLDVPLPPDVMTTLSSDHLGEGVQIISTYVRTCASRDECDPTIVGNVTFTTEQSGNFSSGDATYFDSMDALSFADEGTYVIAAVAVLGNAENATVLYYFEAFAEIVVQTEVAVETASYDKTTTYCRETAQDPLDDMLDSSSLVVGSESCEIAVAISSANVVQADQAMDVVWTATLTRDSSKEIQLPTPLEAVDVVVDDGTNSESEYYTVVSSSMKLCEREMDCNEYSSAVNVSSKVFSANFTDVDTVTFNASGVVLPTTGWYSGFVQLTLAGADPETQRYDFMTYFEVLATADNEVEQVESETYVDDGSESYCWGVVPTGDDGSVDVMSVAFVGNSSECPYAMNMSVSTTSITTVDTGVQVNWTVNHANVYEDTELSSVVNLTTVYDETTGEYVNLPQAMIYYCNGTTCSPFDTNKTLAYSATATNFSEIDGEASFSSDPISFPSEGTYTLMAYAVVANGENLRIDVASFMRVKVLGSTTTASTVDSSPSKLGLVLGVTVGCIAALALIVLVFMAMRRRRAQREATESQKERRHNIFGFRPLSNTNELPTNSPNSRHSNASDESGSFMYVKAAKSPMDLPRASSLSYDPYSRRSFTEAGIEDSGYSFAFSDSEPPTPSPDAAQTQVVAVTHQF